MNNELINFKQKIKEATSQNNIIIKNTKNYMKSIGLIELTDEIDGDYLLWSEIRNGDSIIHLSFKLRGNKKLIEHFTSQGWEKVKSYRNYSGSPDINESKMFMRACKGVFVAQLEYRTNLKPDNI